MDRRKGLAFFFRKTQPVEDQLSERELSVADGCASVLPERAQSRDRVFFRKMRLEKEYFSHLFSKSGRETLESACESLQKLYNYYSKLGESAKNLSKKIAR